jgi:pyridoxal phosphate enzyme (YggS family)
MNVLLQVFIAKEETKFGWSKEDLLFYLQEKNHQKLDYINICGLMGMATNTVDESQISNEFKGLKLFFDKLKVDYFENNRSFNTLSMGMSSDYKIALKEGATMIRIGSTLFGER